MSDATQYFSDMDAEDPVIPEQSTLRLSVPAYERLSQLYAFGHSETQMVEILTNEFQDVDMNPITLRSLKRHILAHKGDLERRRLEITQQCKEHVERQIAALFHKASEQESRMVEVYLRKMAQVLDELHNIDLFEVNPDTGAWKNISRTFVLLELCDKFQGKVAKIVGTDTIREIEAFKERMRIKAQSEELKNNLIPEMRDANGKETNTQWM